MPDRQGPVGDLDVTDAQLVQPRDEAVDAPVAKRDLRQRAAEHDGHLGARVAAQLRLEVGGHERRSPAELDEVDAGAADLQQALRLGAREPLVEHVRQPALTRLGTSLRQVQETGQRRATSTGRRRR